MPKAEREFFDTQTLSWALGGCRSSSAAGEGVVQKLLSVDERYRCIKLPAQVCSGVERTVPITHDFREEVIILERESCTTNGFNKTFTKGMYACRQPGMQHGPIYEPLEGCLTFETRYYKK